LFSHYRKRRENCNNSTIYYATLLRSITTVRTILFSKLQLPRLAFLKDYLGLWRLYSSDFDGGWVCHHRKSIIWVIDNFRFVYQDKTRRNVANLEKSRSLSSLLLYSSWLVSWANNSTPLSRLVNRPVITVQVYITPIGPSSPLVLHVFPPHLADGWSSGPVDRQFSAAFDPQCM